MRRIIVGLLFLTSLIGKVDELPTMTLLRPQASEILSDSEGRTTYCPLPGLKTWRVREISRGRFQVLGDVQEMAPGVTPEEKSNPSTYQDKTGVELQCMQNRQRWALLGQGRGMIFLRLLSKLAILGMVLLQWAVVVLNLNRWGVFRAFIEHEFYQHESTAEQPEPHYDPYEPRLFQGFSRID